MITQEQFFSCSVKSKMECEHNMVSSDIHRFFSWDSSKAVRVYKSFQGPSL